MAEVLDRNLSASLRPCRFSEVVGYDEIKKELTAQIASGRVPTSILFEGISRGGKTTLARIVAVSLNCSHGPFGEPCDECIEHEANFDIIERNAAALGTADDTRKLLEVLPFQPTNGNYRVIILSECQQMTTAAQNILLKPVEDAQSFNVFIFDTTDARKIIPAILKRCMRFSITGLNQSEIEQLVFRTSAALPVFNTDPARQDLAPLADRLYQRGIVAPGEIVMAVERLSNGVPVEQAAVSTEVSGKVDIGLLCGSIIKGDWGGCRKALLDAEPKDGAEIRVILGGYFRKKLLDPMCPAGRSALLTDFIHELADHNTPEVGLQLSAVTASIWKICNWINEASRSAQQRRAA